MSRTPLDTWSKREQLCLASAVSCSGDQNWITVSRTLKAVCGNGHTRPADWYSQKNCAVQYGHLLETVESTKRKKRTNENSGFSSPATVAVETPTELLLRRLTEERQLEIKTQMRRDQELYSKVQREIEALQANELSEQQLQQMWQEIEKEQDAKRIDEMKLENRMREREQRKKDTSGNWRNSSGAGRRSNLTADTTSVDMDVEDIAGNNNKQQAVPPAPLLTSLLKSPGGSNNNNGNNATSPTASSTGAGAGVARATATAPTITSLLTSGASAMPKQPAVVLKSPNDPAFMTRPISGPPSAEVAIAARSPSQAAPTLSMLLEKNKVAAAATASTSGNETPAKSASAESANLSQKQPDVELDATATGEDATDEADEADEQQLLEVFKTIENIIDDIDIDMVMGEDILKDVDNVISPAAAAPAKAEVVDFEDKLDSLKREESVSRKSSKSPAQSKTMEPVVIGSSDDSNDNIPLAAVASQESSKDRNQHTGESTLAAADEAVAEELNETITIASSSSEENGREAAPVTEVNTVESAETPAGKSPAAAATAEANTGEKKTKKEESTHIQDADAKSEQMEATSEAAPKADPSKESDKDKAAAKPNSELKTSVAAATSCSVQDTDEESSSLTDSSKNDEPPRSARSKLSAEHKPEAEASARQTPPRGSGMGSTPAPAPAPAPAPVSVRPPLLRKLPHRDRSESPMVDDDTTTASDQSTARSSTRRRCSSTPLIDSIPNSPASSEHTDDRRETRAASKKLLLSIYSTLQESKHATPFRRAFHDEHPHRQADLCLRPMDLPSIKRNIDSGQLRSISELQRDVLLMCQNLLLIYKPSTTQHKTARLFMQECRGLKEFASTGVSQTQSENSSVASSASGKTEKEKEKEKERTPAGNKARSGSRKSQRHH